MICSLLSSRLQMNSSRHDHPQYKSGPCGVYSVGTAHPVYSVGTAHPVYSVGTAHPVWLSVQCGDSPSCVAEYTVWGQPILCG